MEGKRGGWREEGWREGGMAGGDELVAGGMQAAIRLVLPGEPRSRCALLPSCGHGCDRSPGVPTLSCAAFSPSLTSSSSKKQHWQRGDTHIDQGNYPGQSPQLWVGGRGPVLGCGQHPGEGRLLQPLCRVIPLISPLARLSAPPQPLVPSGMGAGSWKGEERGMEKTPAPCLVLLRVGAAREAAQLLGELPEV